jgi:hypothetical protein
LSSLDEIAKGLATGNLSRGKALRWMGGALLGAALASFPGVAWADDDCRRLGRECRRDSQCCSRNCVRRGDDKVCGCPEGKRRCADRCVNLQRNERHCGRCGNRCEEETTCVNGACCPNAQVCGTGTSLTCCPEGQECDDEFGVCIPPTGPNRLICVCNDNTTITRCSSVDCSSGPQQDLVCVPLCASRGGLFGTDCGSGSC